MPRLALVPALARDDPRPRAGRRLRAWRRVLTTQAFSGGLVLRTDGTFARGSILAVELDTLKSDSDLRDEWIKINTLQTRLHPRAEFAALRVADLPLPLPRDGEWTVRLEGTMRIHGSSASSRGTFGRPGRR